MSTVDQWRGDGGYPSDLTGEQWKLIEPLLPVVKRGGRPEKHPRRAIVDVVVVLAARVQDRDGAKTTAGSLARGRPATRQPRRR